jgi:hypothetical protein
MLRQFILIFERNMKFAIRNPNSSRAFLIMTLIQAFLMCSIFRKVGNQNFDFSDSWDYELLKKNLKNIR